jgi:hypothetical protein
MKRITIKVSDETAERLAELATACTASGTLTKGETTHGALTVNTLLAMLAEDAGMVISRPGSWEGSRMAEVLVCHGYQL